MPSASAVRRTPLAALAVLAVLPAVARAGAAPAPTGQIFDYRHNGGDQAVYDYKLSCRAQVKEVDGPNKAEAEISLQMKCLAEFLGDTASGDQGVRGEIASGTLRVKGEGEDESLDLPELTVKYIISSRGRVKDASILSGDPPVLHFMGAVLIFGPEDAFLASGVGEFPHRPLKKGDKWEGTEDIPNPVTGESQKVSYKSVLVGEEKFQGAVCQKIKTTRSSTFGGTIEDPQSGAAVHLKAKVSGEIVWLFDPQRKLIMSSQAKESISVTTRFELEGESRTAATSGVMNARSVLTEYNGVPVTVK